MNRKGLSGAGYRKISQEKAQKLEDVLSKTKKKLLIFSQILAQKLELILPI